jgi:RNA polymerase sigma-70 factor (ECF subfamily)
VAHAENFEEAIRRIRAGDEQAAADLVRRFEPLVRREIRLNLKDQRLARVFDSMDVCQSVLASFFVRTAAGQYDLENPQQLTGLLVQMARHKLASTARRQYRQRRDVRRAEPDGDALQRVAQDDPSPSQQVAGHELLERLRAQLTDEERCIAELRGEGLSWDEIATRLGGKAQARRMQLVRAIERVTARLGLDETND